MPFRTCLSSLERHGALLANLLTDAPPGLVDRRPADGGWNLREIAGHLLDEERLDFRVRIDGTLHRPGEPWPSIDPEGWVAAHGYAGLDLAETVAAFRAEREESLEWLRTLEDAPWERAYEHPGLSVLRPGDLLAAWAAHDLLHERQILRRSWEHLTAAAAPYVLDYAGTW